MASAIVCGIDGSSHARAAAQLAVTLAGRLGLRLIGVHALGAAHPYELGRAGNEVARRRMHDLVSDVLQAAGADDAEVRVEADSAPQLLAAAADEEDAAFVVVGTRGAGSVRSAILGSASAALAPPLPVPRHRLTAPCRQARRPTARRWRARRGRRNS